MKHVAAVFMTLACATSSLALADGPLPSIPVDSRIKMLTYDESDVYTINSKYGYQTNIVFDRGEEIETISMGDRSPWQIIPSGNRLFIRPMMEDVTTNMTILTNKRSYQFDLKSVSGDKAGIVYVAKFIYPDMRPKAPMLDVTPAEPVKLVEPATTPYVAPASPLPPAAYRPSVPAPATGPGITQPVNPNFNYTYSGPDELAPIQVFDDGKAVFIRYSQLREPLPSVFITEADGREMPATFRIQDDMLVVEGIAKEITLKSNNGTVIVYNEMINPQ